MCNVLPVLACVLPCCARARTEEVLASELDVAHGWRAADAAAAAAARALGVREHHQRRREDIEVVGLRREAEAPVGLAIAVVVPPAKKLGELEQLVDRLERLAAGGGEDALSPGDGDVVNVERQRTDG